MTMTKDKIMIGKSNISGNGVYAKKNIKKGERICFMKGELIDIDEMIKRVDNNLEKGSDPLGVDDEMYIDMFELYRSINHSCNPNCFLRRKNELVAIKNIKKNEEITYDYSTTMDDNKKKIRDLWTMKCKCKNKNCRKIIDQFKTLPKKRQNYYIKNKFAPDFILRKYK
jgi:uncharacterized protein